MKQQGKLEKSEYLLFQSVAPVDVATPIIGKTRIHIELNERSQILILYVTSPSIHLRECIREVMIMYKYDTYPSS